MKQDDIDRICRTLKRDEMPFSAHVVQSLRYGRSEIDRIIPHRDPFAFVDRITAVDLESAMIEVESDIDADNPVFQGHFPHRPVYPGVLQVETMGQAGLCLAFFVKRATTEIHETASPVDGLFTRVHEAAFLKPVRPGVRLRVRVKTLDDNDYTGLMAAQVFVDEDVCSFGILEVFYP